jgi:Predicted transcriptional regulator
MPRKWNQDATASEKLLSLYSMLLFSGREASLTELSKELHCSKQAVLRLVDQLEASRHGKLVRSKRGREVCYSIERPKQLPKISLNAEGLYQLALCRNFILHLLPDAMRKTVDATLQQASAYVDDDLPAKLGAAGSAFDKGRIDYSPFSEMLHTLMRGIRENRVCALRYKANLVTEEKSYDFAPKRLIAFRETIYLAGWMVTDKGSVEAIYEKPTNLAVHRLKEVTLTRRTAEHLPEPKESSEASFGFMAGTVFSVKVRFSPEAATYVAERQWSNDQQVVVHKDGGITISFTARSDMEILSWVLGFGDQAKVLSPKWLKDAVVDNATEMLGMYTK